MPARRWRELGEDQGERWSAGMPTPWSRTATSTSVSVTCPVTVLPAVGYFTAFLHQVGQHLLDLVRVSIDAQEPTPSELELVAVVLELEAADDALGHGGQVELLALQAAWRRSGRRRAARG